MNIGQRIIEVRGKESRKAFSERIGIVENTLRNYEQNLSLPNSDVIASICSSLGIEPVWLLFGRGPMRTGEKPTPRPETALAAPSESCAKCAVFEAENKLLREFKTAQDETIKAQAETLKMYKMALEAAQQELFKGDRGMPAVPPSARSVPTSTELNK